MCMPRSVGRSVKRPGRCILFFRFVTVSRFVFPSIPFDWRILYCLLNHSRLHCPKVDDGIGRMYNVIADAEFCSCDAAEDGTRASPRCHSFTLYFKLLKLEGTTFKTTAMPKTRFAKDGWGKAVLTRERFQQLPVVGAAHASRSVAEVAASTACPELAVVGSVGNTDLRSRSATPTLSDAQGQVDATEPVDAVEETAAVIAAPSPLPPLAPPIAETTEATDALEPPADATANASTAPAPVCPATGAMEDGTDHDNVEFNSHQVGSAAVVVGVDGGGSIDAGNGQAGPGHDSDAAWPNAGNLVAGPGAQVHIASSPSSKGESVSDTADTSLVQVPTTTVDAPPATSAATSIAFDGSALPHLCEYPAGTESQNDSQATVPMPLSPLEPEPKVDLGPSAPSAPSPTTFAAEQVDPNLVEACKWPGRYVQTCANDRATLGIPCNTGEEVVSWVREHCKLNQLSTTFSGIDAPGTAANLMHDNLEIPMPQHVQAIEKDDACIDELLIKPSGPECVFGCVTLFFVPALISTIVMLLKSGSENVLEILTPVIKSRKSVRPTAHCHRHGKQCNLRCADVEFAGSPCHEFSSRGDRSGVYGRNMVAALAWIAIQLMLMTPVIVHENVPGFPLQLLEFFFGI